MPIFAVRDDDINFFSSVEMLRRVYIEELPFVRPSLCITPRAGEVYEQILLHEASVPSRQDKLLFAKRLLAEGATAKYDWRRNQELVTVLKALLDRDAEVCLHGVTHNASPVGFECESPAPGKEFFSALIREIDAELATTVRVFSPPNNSINGAWLDVVRASGLNMVTSVGIRPNESGWPMDGMLAMARILPLHLLSRGNNRSWITCRYRGVKSIQSYPISVFSKRNEVLGVIRDAYRRNKNFVLAIHSYQFNEPDRLYDLFKDACYEAKQLGFRFGTLSTVLDA